MAKKKTVKTNKKSSKLRRTVLGTLSGVFMVSALIVAAIPVKDVAAEGESSIPFTDNYAANPDSIIPKYVTSNAPVFYDGDGLFAVAYVNRDTDIAGVLVYYDGDSVNAPASLVIPDTIDAYQYEYNSSDYRNYLRPVYADGNFLYYISQEREVDEETGDEIQPEVISPCYAYNKSEWEGKTLYASVDGKTKGDEQSQLTIPVRYIGSTKYVPTQNSDGTISGSYDDTTGVFEGARNFNSVSIPGHILAIGNNAFKKCQMSSVSIGDQVKSIGNHAFDGCNLLTSVKLTESGATNLQEIGSYAFANCTYLNAVDIPGQVVTIGSGCFMNCENLLSANLYGAKQDGNASLEHLGNGAFYNCTSLERIYLPDNLSGISDATYLFYGCSNLTELGLTKQPGNFGYTNVTGCSKLLTVSVPNSTMTFDCNCTKKEGSDYCDGTGSECTFGKKNLGYNTPFGDYEVDDRFCIMAYRNSPAYTYACEHEYSVGYLDEGYKGQYERVQDNYFYTIDSDGNLKKFGLYKESGDASIVSIPDNIGSKQITSIDSNTFQYFEKKDEIEYVYIPASVKTIGENAFKGCTQLQEVEFADAKAVESIGTGAFKTMTTDDSVKLRFVGSVGLDSEPYVYAMNPENNYNDSSLSTKYISYTSEFPSNLQIELVVEKDPLTNQIVKTIPTLVDAPDYDDFQSGVYSLSINKSIADEQNAIVQSAYTKYRGQTTSADSSVTYSEDEQAVLDAVFRVVIPDGVYGMESDVYQGNQYITSAVLNSILDVPDGAFAGCSGLQTFVMRSSGVEGERIGEKVFEDDDQLVNVILPSTLEEMDSLPFYECSNLEYVDFSGSPNFTCDNAIIYENLDDGTQKIIECLETRGLSVGTGKVRAEEMANVSEIAPHAFENCQGITQVYFGEAPLETIPEYCFNDCTKLNYCEVSDYTKSIGEYAFRNTALSDIRIPSNVQLISENAFVTTDDDGTDSLLKGLNIQCEVPSAAYEFAKKYGFGTEDRILHKYTVKFYNYDGTEELSSQMVEEGSDAVPPEEVPEREGMKFTGWLPNYTDVSSDLNVYPQYEYIKEDDSEDNKTQYTVTFYNYDGSMKISVQKVAEGSSAKAPTTIPERDGYTFIGWLPEYDNIISDLDVYPQYKSGSSSSDTGSTTDDTNGSSDGSSSTGNNTSTGTNGTSGTNSTSGTSSTSGTNGTSSTGTTSTSKGTSSTVSGNRTSSSSSSNKNTGSGTTVSVSKTGISNTNLVSATVAGSSDDYVVKIADSESARSAVEQALLNEYGSIDDIRYFAMDISLYDKTGVTKIQNTDGLSVTITMPIPDALASYAGNNKAGAVINGDTLEKLEAKFTTIDGVPCISFVATHFSPYTVYVDLNNMSATGTIDSTPITGDPIHPKWFLSIGLALMSVILFFMKGSKGRVVKVIPG